MLAGVGYEPTLCRIASQAFTALRPEIARPLGHGGRSDAIVIPTSFCFINIQNGLPLWCWLIQLVLEK